MSMTVEERKAVNKALIDEVLKAYPDKMRRLSQLQLNSDPALT